MCETESSYATAASRTGNSFNYFQLEFEIATIFSGIGLEESMRLMNFMQIFPSEFDYDPNSYLWKQLPCVAQEMYDKSTDGVIEFGLEEDPTGLMTPFDFC